MVSSTKCYFCGAVTSNCFGDTGEDHKRDCPAYVHRC